MKRNVIFCIFSYFKLSYHFTTITNLIYLIINCQNIEDIQFKENEEYNQMNVVNFKYDLTFLKLTSRWFLFVFSDFG